MFFHVSCQILWMFIFFATGPMKAFIKFLSSMPSLMLFQFAFINKTIATGKAFKLFTLVAVEV